MGKNMENFPEFLKYQSVKYDAKHWAHVLKFEEKNYEDRFCLS